MAEQPSNAPVDAEVETQPGNEVDEAQENVGRDNMAGQGEWPDPDTPPTGPAPGERGPTSGPAPGTASQPETTQVGPEDAGDAGPARLSETEAADETPAATFKDVLEADPVVGGSATFPPDENPAAQQPAATAADRTRGEPEG